MWVTLTKGAKRNPGQGTPQADQLLNLLLLVVAGTIRDRNFCLILSGILFRWLAHVAPRIRGCAAGPGLCQGWRPSLHVAPGP